MEELLKAHQQKDNERVVRIQELEEKLYKFEHGSKLEVLAQLAMVEVENKEPISQGPIPHIITPTRPTVVSLGVELWKRTQEFSQKEKEWAREKNEIIFNHTRELEKQ